VQIPGKKKGARKFWALERAVNWLRQAKYTENGLGCHENFCGAGLACRFQRIRIKRVMNKTANLLPL
jgi:hypothetical protein